MIIYNSDLHQSPWSKLYENVHPSKFAVSVLVGLGFGPGPTGPGIIDPDGSTRTDDEDAHAD